jgi:hypothetical protein
MTTIAASLALRMMAADSRTTLYASDGTELHAYASTKLVRLPGLIVGCAGEQSDIDAFMTWLADRRRRRPKCGEDFSALMLTHDDLFVVHDNAAPERVRCGFMAVGSGGGFAMAALNAMVRVGHDPDPRIATEVACDHDPHSALPIDFLTWRRKRGNTETER